MDEQQLAAQVPGKLLHVGQDRAIGGGGLDRDEDVAIHGAILSPHFADFVNCDHNNPAAVWYKSQPFSTAISTPVTQASPRIHAGATNDPIFARSDVNMMRGNTANGSCRLRIT